MPGILAWAVRGCLEWQQEGLGLPEEVRAATATYREEMDIFGPFFEDHCVFESGALVTSKALNTAYDAWCERNGEKPRSAKALANVLRERGASPARGAKGVRCWSGLRLRREDEELQRAGDGCRMGDASAPSFREGDEDHDPAQAGSPEGPDLAREADNPSASATRHPSATRHQGWEEGEL